MKRILGIGVTAVLLAAIMWLIPWPHVRYWASFLFIWILPGIAWMPLVNRSGIFSTIETVIVALGLNFAAVPLIMLLITYLPGQNSKIVTLLLFSFVILFSLTIVAFQSRRNNNEIKPSIKLEQETPTNFSWLSKDWVWLVVILLLAAVMRLTYLGYSEFQGDEAAVLVRSARIMTGEDTLLFQHKKGPLELLLPMAGWDFTGISNEWMARLPFAFASILGVGAVFLYGLRQSALLTAIMAGGLMALEGYLVGFGRIVQYQSAVILFSSLAIFCLLVFQQKGARFLLIFSALFFSVASWAHYDAVLFLPAGILLILSRLKLDQVRWREAFPTLVLAGILGLFLVGLFYYPFIRSSQAEGTLFYMSSRIGSDQFFYNHLQSTFDRTFVYDSLYLLLLIFGGLTLQILFAWRSWGRVGIILAIFLLIGFFSTLIFPQWWEIGEYTFAWTTPFILLLGALIAPKQKPGIRALWLWFGVPAVFFLYFVALPLTHVYTAVPGAVLLAAMGIYKAIQWFSARSPGTLRVAMIAIVILFAIGAAYTIISFVSHSPEYVREYPESKIAVFWTPFGDDLPEEGLFGFPYRAGWKTVGYLMDKGELSGSYDSNEERDVTDYYMRRAMRFDCATPDIYVIAENVQDEVPVRSDQIESQYQKQFVVEVQGQPKSAVYVQDRSGDVQTIAVQDFDILYDLETTPDAVASASPAVTGQPPSGFFPLDGQVGEFAELIGYQLETENARPGGYIELILLWRALSVAPIDFQVFTHLHDGQNMRGQLDGQPVCNSAPTSRWQKGDFIIDPYRIPVHPQAATGPVPLTVGMYDLATLERLPVVQPAYPERVDSIFIEDVEIKQDG